MAISPVNLNGAPFMLPGLKDQCFYYLGTQEGNKGVSHTCYISKKVIGSEYTLDPELLVLSGVCKYAFLRCGNTICGVLVLSPTALTNVSPFVLAIRAAPSEEEKDFTPRFDLQPQGIIICQSKDEGILLVGEAASTLLVRVDA